MINYKTYDFLRVSFRMLLHTYHKKATEFYLLTPISTLSMNDNIKGCKIFNEIEYEKSSGRNMKMSNI